MDTTSNFTNKEDNKGFESNGDDQDDVVLQVGAEKRAQDDDEIKTTSPNLKNFMNHSCQKGLIVAKIERSSPESETRSSSAKRKQLDEQLGSSVAELDEVIEENQRLKMYLDRILKDYKTLQMQYQEITHDAPKKYPNSLIPIHRDRITEEPDELIALSLGRNSPNDRKNDEHRKTPLRNETTSEEGDREGLALGLDCRTFQVPKKSSDELHSPNHCLDISLEEAREEEDGELSPRKTGKNVRESGDDETTQQNPTKRARVSVRVRCDTPTMNDGCQWRKYGQKIAKGNPCPRAYYRCTVATSCPVRKQVQRCAQDMSILITTYEGTHNHPLSISATAMASTTSAAASMLISGSSTSTTGPGPSSTTTATMGNLNGLNFYVSENNYASRSKPFYLPNSSISASPSFPTITLDLTSNSTSSSTTASHLSRLANLPQGYSTTNLNFSSLESNPFPISYNNGMLSYGSPQPLNNKNQTTSNSLNFGAQPYETLYQSYLQKNNTNPNVTQDSIAAATKAITSDPIFQSALVAALSSIIGSNGANATELLPNRNEAVKSSQTDHIKTNEPSFNILSSFPTSTPNANKCAPSFLNKPSSATSSSQPSGLMFLSPPFSDMKSKSSSSPSDYDVDHAA